MENTIDCPAMGDSAGGTISVSIPPAYATVLKSKMIKAIGIFMDRTLNPEIGNRKEKKEKRVKKTADELK